MKCMEIQNHLSNEKRGESFQHVKIKRYLMKNIPQDNNIKIIREEVAIGNRIADIFCQLANDKKVVIEVQHSMISVKSIIQRTRDYNDSDCHVLWVFNASSFDRYPKNEASARVLNFEKTCQKLFHGRVYYINAFETGNHTPLYPLYFNCFYEQKFLPVGFNYYRKSRSLKSIVLGELESLELKLFKNLNLKLARFNDENVRDQCLKEIKLFLANQPLLTKIVSSLKELSDKDKLLCAITAKFGRKYGVDLIYDILKQKIKIYLNGNDLHVMKSYFTH
jgi:competence CoiA-like predicted nuclease